MSEFRTMSIQAQDAAIEIYCLKLLLGGCIIPDSYEASAEVDEALKFTEQGEILKSRIMNEIEGITAAETALHLLLAFDSSSGFLVDVVNTNVTALKAAISQQLLHQDIFFAWVFGRELVDQIVAKCGVQPKIGNRDSVELLKANQTGVFQMGNNVVGPYGLTTSPEFRIIRPTREVFGYLEVRGSTSFRRNFVFTSGEESRLWKNAPLVARALENTTSASRNHYELMNKLLAKIGESHNFPDAILRVLGGTLDDNEARQVALRLLPRIFRRENGHSAFQKSTQSIVGDPSNFLEGLDRQRLQQIFTFGTNVELFHSLDEAIYDGVIKFNEGSSRFASFADKSPMRLELTNEGVRLDWTRPASLFATNVMELLHHLYVELGLAKVEDLMYLLSSSEQDIGSLINELVTKREPEEVIQFICGQPSIARRAAEHLGIWNFASLNVRQLEAQVSYKLGIRKSVGQGALDRLSAQISQFESLPVERVEEIRATAVNLFVELETILLDSIAFTHWALVEPKKPTHDSFVCNLEKIRNAWSFGHLFRAQVSSSEKPTIQPLGEAFKRLSVHLSQLEKSPFEITSEQIRAEKSGKSAAFRYREMFHNLSLSSQNQVLDSLKFISEVLSEGLVGKVRNKLVHGNTDPITAEEISDATIQLRGLTERIRIGGYYPVTWIFESTTTSFAGFTVTRFKNSERRLEIQEPSRSFSPGMQNASSSTGTIFFNAARLEHLGPLRFTFATEQVDEEYWSSFPPRLITVPQSDSDSQIAMEQGEQISQNF
jgi:hypothetical protein